MATSSKVGQDAANKKAKGKAEPKAPKEKKEKVAKKPFSTTLPKDTMVLGIDDKAKLVVLPIEGQEFTVGDETFTVTDKEVFNPKNHAPLKKVDFADNALWLEWRSHQLTQKGDDLHKKAAKLQQEAEEWRNSGGDKAAVRKKKRAAKLVAQLKELKAALGEDFDLDALLAANEK